MLTGSTLIVVADGSHARFLSRGGPAEGLVERPDLEMAIGPAGRQQTPSLRAFNRTGAGRHAMQHRPTARELSAYAFLADVAEKAGDVLARWGFAHLVVCAPPALLAALREALTNAAREKLALSLGKDIARASVAEIDVRMRELRV